MSESESEKAEDLTPKELEKIRALLKKPRSAAADGSSSSGGAAQIPAIVHHRTRGLATPSKFSDGNITEWLDRFEVCATANEWVEATKIVQIPTFLEGRAFAIFKEVPNPAALSFDELRQALVDKFLPPESRSARYNEFQVAKIKPTESTEAFTYRLEQMLSVAIPDLDGTARTEILKHQFIKGMPSLVEIRLLENPTYTYAQCVVAARQLLAVHRDGLGSVSSEKSGIKSTRIGNSEERSSLAMAGHSNRDDSRPAQPQFRGRNPSTAVNRGGQRAYNETRSCYNCGKPGHLARDCRTPRGNTSRYDAHAASSVAAICQICSRAGHTALNCYKRYDQSGPRKFQQSKPPSGMASTGEYRLRVQVNGTPMRLLVDTGASHSYMSWTTYMKNFRQVPTRDPPAELKSTKVANGDKMPTRAVVDLQVAAGSKLVAQQFLLVNSLGTDAILGTDFYNDHVRSIHLKDRTVEFDDGQTLKMDFIPAVEVSNRLIVAESVTVGARSQTYIPFKLRSACNHGRDLLVVDPNAFY